MAANELEKLAILDGKVTAKDIDNLVYSAAPLSIESLWAELFDKKPVTPIIRKLLELGEDEFSILRALQYFINDIFLINAYIKLNGRPDFKEIFGYQPPKHIQERKQTLALKVNSAALLKLYELLLEYELLLKQAPAAQREALLYGMLINVQSVL
jgi:DNA polymerase-3 subunit delta